MNNGFELITSRQNTLLVETGKLSDRKHRVRSGQFRFDGIKLAAEALSNDVELTAVLLRQSEAQRVSERILSMSGRGFSGNTRIVCVEDSVFDRLSEENAPEGVICVARMQTQQHRIWSEGDNIPLADERIMLVESVRDPSNLGAIIRSAAAFSVDRLIISSDCADIYHAKTVRASMGTLFSQAIDRTDKLSSVIAHLRASGHRVFAAALDDHALRLGSFELQQGDCAVIGNEGHGLCEETIAACSNTVYIPMSARAESLNASVAAAILMWEFFGASGR